MAKLIRTDGTETEVQPKNGKKFTLDELRSLTGCEWVEFVRLHDGSKRLLVVDEEGKLNSKDYNEKATVISSLMPHDYIVGDALLCMSREV